MLSTVIERTASHIKVTCLLACLLFIPVAPWENVNRSTTPN